MHWRTVSVSRVQTDGSWSFTIPQPLEAGTIIGDTKQPNDWNPYSLPEIRQTLLSNAARWFPFAADGPRTFEVIRAVSNGTVYCGGQLPMDSSGKMVQGDMQTKTRQCITNLKAVLENAGSDLSLVLKVTVRLLSLSLS